MKLLRRKGLTPEDIRQIQNLRDELWSHVFATVDNWPKLSTKDARRVATAVKKVAVKKLARLLAIPK